MILFFLIAELSTYHFTMTSLDMKRSLTGKESGNIERSEDVIYNISDKITEFSLQFYVF